MMLTIDSEMTGPEESRPKLVAHTLFYFTKESDLVFDPMAGGGWLHLPVLHLTEDAGLLIFLTGLKQGLK